MPGAIAGRALSQALFGPGHRYGRPQAGGAAEIAAFTVADLRGFHAARYTPAASSLVVVGGDRAKVEAPLRALNLGPLRVLSVDAVMGKAPTID